GRRFGQGGPNGQAGSRRRRAADAGLWSDGADLQDRSGGGTPLVVPVPPERHGQGDFQRPVAFAQRYGSDHATLRRGDSLCPRSALKESKRGTAWPTPSARRLRSSSATGATPCATRTWLDSNRWCTPNSS